MVLILVVCKRQGREFDPRSDQIQFFFDIEVVIFTKETLDDTNIICPIEYSSM